MSHNKFVMAHDNPAVDELFSSTAASDEEVMSCNEAGRTSEFLSTASRHSLSEMSEMRWDELTSRYSLGLKTLTSRHSPVLDRQTLTRGRTWPPDTLINGNPPPPGGFPICYVPSSRIVCKRTPLEGFVPGSSRGVLLHTVLDEGTQYTGNPPGGEGFFRSTHSASRHSLIWPWSSYSWLWITYICKVLTYTLRGGGRD